MGSPSIVEDFFVVGACECQVTFSSGQVLSSGHRKSYCRHLLRLGFGRRVRTKG